MTALLPVCPPKVQIREAAVVLWEELSTVIRRDISPSSTITFLGDLTKVIKALWVLANMSLK